METRPKQHRRVTIQSAGFKRHQHWQLHQQDTRENNQKTPTQKRRLAAQRIQHHAQGATAETQRTMLKAQKTGFIFISACSADGPFLATDARPKIRETLCGNSRQPVWKLESQCELQGLYAFSHLHKGLPLYSLQHISVFATTRGNTEEGFAAVAWKKQGFLTA